MVWTDITPKDVWTGSCKVKLVYGVTQFFFSSVKIELPSSMSLRKRFNNFDIWVHSAFDVFKTDVVK